MKHALAGLVAGVICLGSVVVMAQEAEEANGGYRLRLGVSMRRFDDVDYGRIDFRNFGDQNNPVRGGPYGIQDVEGPVVGGVGEGLATPVNLDYVRWNGGSHDIDDSDRYAPVVGFERSLAQYNDWTIDVVGNLQLFCVRTRMGANGSTSSYAGFTVEQYVHGIVDIDPGPADDVVYEEIFGSLVQNVPPLDDGTVFFAAVGQPT